MRPCRVLGSERCWSSQVNQRWKSCRLGTTYALGLAGEDGPCRSAADVGHLVLYCIRGCQLGELNLPLLAGTHHNKHFGTYTYTHVCNRYRIPCASMRARDGNGLKFAAIINHPVSGRQGQVEPTSRKQACPWKPSLLTGQVAITARCQTTTPPPHKTQTQRPTLSATVPELE